MKLLELHEELGQPKARKKKVWDADEHQGKKKKVKEGNAIKSAPTYTWPRTTFHGQAQGHAEHILH